MTRSEALGQSRHGRLLHAIASKDARLAQTDVADNAVGYLSVVEHKSDGLFGGYLIVTPNGRPVEFHCTTPLVANRAQEILYGASLRPYLCGELISQQLLRQAGRPAAVVLVDAPEMLVAESFTEIPVVRIGSAGDRHDTEGGEFQVAHSCQDFALGRGELANYPAASSTSTSVLDMSRYGDDEDFHRIAGLDGRCYHLAFGSRTAQERAEGVLNMLRSSSAAIDLLEPFQRIRMAIEEARKMSAA